MPVRLRSIAGPASAALLALVWASRAAGADFADGDTPGDATSLEDPGEFTAGGVQPVVAVPGEIAPPGAAPLDDTADEVAPREAVMPDARTGVEVWREQADPAAGDTDQPPEGPVAADPAGGSGGSPATDGSAPQEPAPAALAILDRSHQTITDSLSATVLWFDHFFGEDKRLDDLAETDVRLRSAVRSGQDRAFAHRLEVWGTVSLPRLARWFSGARLFVAGETARDGAPEQRSGMPHLDVRGRIQQGAAELRLRVFEAPRASVDVGPGLRLGWPLRPFLALRLRTSFPVLGVAVGRATASGFWEQREGFGEQSQLDFDAPLPGGRTMLRWRNSARITQELGAFEWGSEAGVLREIDSSKAVFLGGGATGTPGTGWFDDRWRAFTRMRWSYLRRWMFFEVEPEVFWRRDVVGDFRPGVASTVRVEVHFDGGDATAARARASLNGAR